jgi:hypothetical protein
MLEELQVQSVSKGVCCTVRVRKVGLETAEKKKSKQVHVMKTHSLLIPGSRVRLPSLEILVLPTLPVDFSF